MGRSTDQWRRKTGECSEANASRLMAEAVPRATDESCRVAGLETSRVPPGAAEATDWTMHGTAPPAVWNNWRRVGLSVGLRARIAPELGESDSPAESRRVAERDTKSPGCVTR